MHYSDSLLITFYSSYMFRRVYVIIREPSFEYPAELHYRCVQFVLYVKESTHSAVVVNKTIAAPDHRCIYCHPDKAQILTLQCNQCYSDFTVGILKVLLTTTTGRIDSLTYIIQPYAH
jgi:hypothetical protein